MNIHHIAERLGGARRAGGGWVARCPAHTDESPSLKLDARNDGRLLIKCFAGCEQERVIDALKALDLWGDGNNLVSAAPSTARPNWAKDGSQRARSLWQGSKPAANTLVQTYLRARGIEAEPPASLRFVDRLNHVESGDAWPAMIAGVTIWPSRRVVALQRTFLRRDGSGKAPVTPPKKSLGPTKGGAVRLAAVSECLGLVEGVEDGLSVMQENPSLPCWATLGTEGLRSVALPPLPLAKDVIILADADAAGGRAAKDAARRFTLEGRRVRIAVPPAPAKDFNEALLIARAKDESTVAL